MPYEIIRASGDFKVVVAKDWEHRYYVRNQYENERALFKEATKREAEMYFSGQADGMGFGNFPPHAFAELQEIVEWADICRNASIEKTLRSIWKNGITWDEATNNPDKLLDLLMNVCPLTEVEFKAKLEQYNLTEKWPEFQKRYESKFKPQS